MAKSRYVHKAPVLQPKIEGLKSWQGNAGTIYTTAENKAAVVSSLKAQGFNESGSAAANRAMDLAKKETADIMMAKGGFFPTGSAAAAAAMAEAQQELKTNIENKALSIPSLNNATNNPEYPDDKQKGAGSFIPYLFIGGATLLLLSKK